MKDVYHQNVEELRKKYGSLADKVENVDIDSIEKYIILQETTSGELVLGVGHEGREWLLNSRLNPEQAAEIFLQGHPVREFGIYFLYGFSDGRHVRHILEKFDATNRLMICEPDFELFCVACHYFDLTDIIADYRTWLYFPELEKNIESILRKLIDYTNSKLLDFWILPAYDVLYPQQCNDYMELVVERMRSEIVQKSTRLAFDRKIPRYVLFHMRNLLYHKNLAQLKAELQRNDISEVPAIIVAAGPSLDKNIHLLKEAKGKSFIIVVDAALRAVKRAGIQPDLVCTLDPNVPERFFDRLDLDDIVWACCRGTKISLLEDYGNDVIYYGYYTRAWNERLENTVGYPYPDIESGGSVASEALMIAEYLGFKKIVFIGQDLAFTNGQSHTKGIEGALGDNDSYIKSRYLVQVEGVDGQMLDTDFQMWYYKQWIEKVIKQYQDKLLIIDATEGGAKIEGAIIRTLKDVIETECTRELDIYQIEKLLPLAFSEEQQKELLNELRKLKASTQQFALRTEKMLQQQKALLRRINKGIIGQSQMMFDLNQVLKQCEELKHAPEMDLIVFYAGKEEYEFGDQIYAKENMSVGDLIRQSIGLYEGYYNGARMMLEDIDEFIMKD